MTTRQTHRVKYRDKGAAQQVRKTPTGGYAKAVFWRNAGFWLWRIRQADLMRQLKEVLR